jgi:hypothetical protein
MIFVIIHVTHVSRAIGPRSNRENTSTFVQLASLAHLVPWWLLQARQGGRVSGRF